MEQLDSHSCLVGFCLIAFEIFVLIPLSAHLYPGPMAPGSSTLITATLGLAVIAAAKLAVLMENNIDPFMCGLWYSFALLVLCVEVWFRENPELLNGSRFKGYPIFLFHQPGGNGTKAIVPMPGYTRIFGAWHAGGVCLCFFMHVLGSGFPLEQKAQTALALGLLWAIWATINQWRSTYGASQFCQMGILFHSLTGPGCGLYAYWMLHFWLTNRSPGKFTGGEFILLGTVARHSHYVQLHGLVLMKGKRPYQRRTARR
mmetsp:Transcript_20467/g.44427  ORF Transcript_20467/g.44427 Transcript_20467/m.44427 type:complete len:258 (+) Transcript_20467:68-841(+)